MALEYKLLWDISLKKSSNFGAWGSHCGVTPFRNILEYQFPNIVIFIIRQSKINIEDYSLINISLLSPLKYPRCGVTQKITNFLTKMISNEKTYYKTVVLTWYNFLAALGITVIWNDICLCKIRPKMQNNNMSYEFIY